MTDQQSSRYSSSRVKSRERDVLFSARAAARILAKRQALGWSRDQVASECRIRGLTMSTESLLNIETGRMTNGRRRRTVTIDEIVVFAEVLGCHPAELFNEDGRSPEGKPDQLVVDAVDAAPRVLGDLVGDAVGAVLMDHSEDEFPDPNIHGLAHCVLMLAGHADLTAENRRLTQALASLRSAHHTPYEDEEHRGSNCVDIIVALSADNLRARRVTKGTQT